MTIIYIRLVYEKLTHNLPQGSYKRPPVRHVMMIYGVDLPTEIAYTYRISDNNNPGPPILDEIFYEEPCRKKIGRAHV